MNNKNNLFCHEKVNVIVDNKQSTIEQFVARNGDRKKTISYLKKEGEPIRKISNDIYDQEKQKLLTKANDKLNA